MPAAKRSGWESLLRDHGAGVGAWLMLAKPARYFTVYVYLRGSANGRTLAKALQTQLDRARQVILSLWRSLGSASVGSQ